MDFPYHRNHLPAVSVMFDNLSMYYENEKHRKLIPTKNRIHLTVRSYPNDFNNADSLSDHFSEEVRMNAVFLPNRFKSPMETYLSWSDEIKKQDPEKLRDKLYFESGMANGFNPCILITPFVHYKIKSVFDPCAGWGDRLIVAYVTKLSRYVGFDTNPNLVEPYNKIVSSLSDRSPETNTTIYNSPIEKSPSEWFQPSGQYFSMFDAVATSPPFYTTEIYEGDETSTTLYKSQSEWNEKFYKVMLEKCLSSLKSRGYIFLYISDQMVSMTHKYLSLSVLTQYIGRIGFYQQTGKGPINESKIRDLHIWQRID